MKRTICLAASAVVIACGASHVGPVAPLAANSPTNSTSPSPSPTSRFYQAPPAASSSRTAAPPPTVAGSCRLPYADQSEATGGFISYPSGDRFSDPQSVVALPGNTPGQVGVNRGLAYDLALDKWVPVPPEWLAPGGLTYAYVQMDSSPIRAVKVADGSSGDVTVDGGWGLISTRDDGVYAAKGSTPGAWFVPFGGQPTQVVDHGTWQMFAGDAMWGIDGGGALTRYDMATGTEAIWARLSTSAYLAGFTFDHLPVIDSGGKLTMIRADSTVVTIWPGTDSLSAASRIASDEHGVWFEVAGGLIGAPGHGVYLWSADRGARLISAPEVHIAGPCS